MFLRVLLKQHAFSPSLSQLQPTLLANIQMKSVCNDLAPYLGHSPIPPSRWSSWVWEKKTICPLVYPLMSKRTDQTPRFQLLRIPQIQIYRNSVPLLLMQSRFWCFRLISLFFPIDAWVESPPAPSENKTSSGGLRASMPLMSSALIC